MRNVTVITRVVHRSHHEAINEKRAGFFIDLVFHRVSVHWNFNNDVEVIGRVVAGVDAIEIHV